MSVRFLIFSLVSVVLFGQDAQQHVNRGLEQMRRIVPGSTAPESIAATRLAESEFQAALSVDPSNITAIRSLASLKYADAQVGVERAEKVSRLEEAQRWYERWAALESNNAAPVYTLGVIAWSKAYPDVMDARARSGMRPEDPGPIRDASIRNEVLARHGSTIQDGIVRLETALAIDPRYDDAMAYMNLLYRLRADLSQSVDEYKRDIVAADQWVEKALEVKRAKAEAGLSPNPTMAVAAPPPPPPPPPPIGYLTRSQATPARIRIGGNVQAAKLINAPKPEYPPLARQARIQGTVRYDVVIDKEGRVSNVALISGHPLLVPAATDIVRQYTYQPTLLNGNPVEVLTQVDVNFVLPPE